MIVLNTLTNTLITSKPDICCQTENLIRKSFVIVISPMYHADVFFFSLNKLTTHNTRFLLMIVFGQWSNSLFIETSNEDKSSW